MDTKNQMTKNENNDAVIDALKQFWNNYQKLISVSVLTLIVLVGGYWGFTKYLQQPKEAKANDAIFKAEEYYRMDSLQKALNGDGFNLGFVKVIEKFSGTQAANLAHFYAGDCYLRTGEFVKAVDNLKEFSTDAKQIQARAYKLLADAYSELNKNEEALKFYKKAALHFTTDTYNAADYLFNAAQLAEKIGDPKQAIELYNQLKELFPNTQQSNDADKYLAKLGVYN